MSFGRDRQEFEKVKGELESEINRLEGELEDEAAKSAALRAEIEDVRVRFANAEGRADSAERRVKELDLRNQELSDRLTAEASKASALSERLKHLERAKAGKKEKR